MLIQNEDFLYELDEDSEDELSVPPKRLHLRDTSISRYEKEFFEVCQIGKGEFGSVYKCIHRLDGCTYAIKKSRQPLRNGTTEERIALNEVCAHAVIGAHPHVVRYHSAWAEDGHMVIQSEYCNGGSLADAIEANSRAGSHFPESELKRILFHIAEGLQHFHSHNLAHLDIKPGDLGHVTSLETPQVEEGDCRYLPQEILKEDFSQLPKADMFALGLTVVEAAGACGPLPRNGEEWQAIRTQGHLPPLPPNISQGLRNLLASMIHPDPSLRPTAHALLRDPALSPLANKTKAQLRRALNAERIKNVKLE
ncbi:WEE1, partial [Cordylochernes scorpioides]